MNSNKHKHKHKDKDKDKDMNSIKKNITLPELQMDVVQPTTICPICNKIFKSRTSIYSHKKICSIPTNPKTTSTILNEKYIETENKILNELLKNGRTIYEL